MLGADVSWGFMGRTIVLSAGLLWAFVGLGLRVAATVHEPAKAMMYALFLWALGIALLDFALIGLMLAWHLNARAVFLLAALNPVEAARMALLSAAQPDLGVLGPVGFFLSTHLGARALFALGVAWPSFVGCAAFASGVWRFCRTDIA